MNLVKLVSKLFIINIYSILHPYFTVFLQLMAILSLTISSCCDHVVERLIFMKKNLKGVKGQKKYIYIYIYIYI